MFPTNWKNNTNYMPDIKQYVRYMLDKYQLVTKERHNYCPLISQKFCRQNLTNSGLLVRHENHRFTGE